MEIQDYPGYFIHRDGKVWSDKLCRGVKGRFLKPYKTKSGYMYVMICNNGKTLNLKIHRLIAIHYIPNPNNYPQVDHINRIRHDNRIENLRWASPSMNMDNKSVRIDNKCGIKNISRINYNKRRDEISEYHKEKYFMNKFGGVMSEFVNMLNEY